MILLKFSKFDCYFSMIIARHEACEQQLLSKGLHQIWSCQIQSQGG